MYLVVTAGEANDDTCAVVGISAQEDTLAAIEVGSAGQSGETNTRGVHFRGPRPVAAGPKPPDACRKFGSP